MIAAAVGNYFTEGSSTGLQRPQFRPVGAAHQAAKVEGNESEKASGGTSVKITGKLKIAKDADLDDVADLVEEKSKKSVQLYYKAY